MQRLSLFIFIDALGWEVLKDRKFLEEALPHRQKLRSVFGYSSACVPSILSGKSPQDHGHWSFYYENENDSPFRGLKWLRWLPWQNRGRVRHQLSKFVKRMLGWTGYFQLYNMPFAFLDRFDYCEKNDIFSIGGMNRGDHIFDFLKQQGVPYHVSDWHLGELGNIQALKDDVTHQQPRFAFLYMAALDALLHDVGKNSGLVDEKLDWYEKQLQEVFALCDEQYKDVDIYICSDHGMATVSESINLMAEVEDLDFKFGTDYLAVYDSTMARFWFKNDICRHTITALLTDRQEGHLMQPDELKTLGCDFDAHQYGQLIFLLEPGKIICPSHMGEKPVTGMHGYHPDHPDSDAVLLSSKPLSTNPTSITDINALMQLEAIRS
jgi:hypothetical protein